MSDFFEFRLTIFSHKLPWVKIRYQKLVHLFIHPYIQENNLVFCYGDNIFK